MTIRAIYEGQNVNLANDVWFHVSAYIHDEARTVILLNAHPRPSLTLQLRHSVEQASQAIHWLRDHAYFYDTGATADVSFEVGKEGAPRLADELAKAVAAVADDIAARNAAQQVTA